MYLFVSPHFACAHLIIVYLHRSRAFLSQWQDEHAILEGESHLEEIEDILCADVARTELLRVLRLLCLQSLTAGGIRTAKYDVLRRIISQNYGYQQLFTLSNLEKAGEHT